ncbi:MAG: hypothetical protein M1820_004411 [Bogoriella megaspora]|nr:MAG: hypothetical protein M1820_004411 [Bogoriella megaspora]
MPDDSPLPLESHYIDSAFLVLLALLNYISSFPKKEFADCVDDEPSALSLLLELDKEGKLKLDGLERPVARRPPVGARRPPVAIASGVDLVSVFWAAATVTVETDVAVTRVDTEVTVDAEGQVEPRVTVDVAEQVDVDVVSPFMLIILASIEAAGVENVAVVVVEIDVNDDNVRLVGAAAIATELFVVDDVANASALLVNWFVVALVWARTMVEVCVVVLRKVVRKVEKEVDPDDVVIAVVAGRTRVTVAVTVEVKAVIVAPLDVVTVTVRVTVPVEIDVVFAFTKTVEVAGRSSVVVTVVLTASVVVEVDAVLVIEVVFKAARAEERVELLLFNKLVLLVLLALLDMLVLVLLLPEDKVKLRELRGIPLTAVV